MSQFEARRDKAEATLLIYANNSVGIGDHANIVDEVVRQIEELAHAEECIKLCDSLLKQNKKTQ